MENIRRYDAVARFVSFGVFFGVSAAEHMPGEGPPVYVMHGQVYHRISVLMPSGEIDLSHGQLYIYDPAAAAARRSALDLGL